MNMMSTDETCMQPRDRVVTSVAKTMANHGFSHRQATAFVALAYDHFRDVEGAYPADVPALERFLLKHAEGKAFVVKAKAIFHQQMLDARTIPVNPDDEDVAVKVLPDDVAQRLTERVRQAFRAYQGSGTHHSTRDKEIIFKTLEELANSCEAAGVQSFLMPCARRSGMETAFFHQLRDAKNSRRVPDWFELDYPVEGEVP